MNTNIKIFTAVVFLLILGTVVTAVIRGGGAGVAEAGKYDTFTTCLEEKGAVFYGAFWCPHCQATKKLFGSSQKLLPYVECSTPDGKGQIPACVEKEIVSYPTWEFADGSRLTGEVSLETLAEKTSCALPVDESAVVPPAVPEGADSATPQ